MKKGSLKKNQDKKEKEKDFSKIGDIEQVKSEPKPIIIESKIIYDKKQKQYGCKIPKIIMLNFDYKAGDMLKFKLKYPKDKLKTPKLEVEYVRKNGSKSIRKKNIS